MAGAEHMLPKMRKRTRGACRIYNNRLVHKPFLEGDDVFAIDFRSWSSAYGGAKISARKAFYTWHALGAPRSSPYPGAFTVRLFSCIKGVNRPDTAISINAIPDTTSVGRIPIVSPNQPPKNAPKGIMPVTKKRNAPFILPRTALGVSVCRMVQAKTVIEEFPALNTK